MDNKLIRVRILQSTVIGGGVYFAGNFIFLPPVAAEELIAAGMAEMSDVFSDEPEAPEEDDGE